MRKWMATTVALAVWLAGCSACAAEIWQTLSQSGAVTLGPMEARTIVCTLDPRTADRCIALGVSAFARDRESNEPVPALHVTVNRQYMRTGVLGRSRLLNKPPGISDGAAWGEDTFWKTIGFEGSALWCVPRGESPRSAIQGSGRAEEARLVIDISDLVAPGRRNEIMVMNVSPTLTLVCENIAVLVGPTLADADAVAALRAERRALRKRSRTYFTPERIAAARENIQRYGWAQEIYRKIMEGERISYYGGSYTSAREFVEQSDEFMWLLQPTSKLPRHVLRGSKALRCPVHGWAGKDVDWPGAALCPWRIDPIRHPYKIQCLAGNEWLPTNDYHLGDLTTGEFPDDGTGCLYKGERFEFLAEYAHMVYGSVVIPTLDCLSQAYLITGDSRYAHKAAILLARLATEYPNHEDRRDRLYDKRELGPYRGRGTGMMTDDVWENACLERTAYAYDAIYDYLDDPGLIAFLRNKGMPIETGDDLRAYIEDNLIRSGMKALLLRMIEGNVGMHQAAAMACALVVDDFADCRVNSRDMVDYFYYGVGQAAYAFANGVTPDGGGDESPNYNRIKLEFVRAAQFMETLRNMHPDRFPVDRYPDIFASPKAKAVFDYFLDIFLCDAFIPSIGDAAGIGPVKRASPALYTYPELDYLFAFKRYGDPRYARACTTLDGNLRGGSLFDPYPEGEIRSALDRPESQMDRSPRFFDDYGLAILESGRGSTGRAAYLNYFSWQGHRQHDHLSIGLCARGVDLLPDLGYPYTYEHRYQWDSHSMAHNTVTVDETLPAMDIGGMGRLFASAEGVHLVVASHDPYPPDHRAYPEHYPVFRSDAPPCDVYERMLILVDVDTERWYVVDLFAVNGGEQHDQSWHGPMVPVEHPPLEWTYQKGGTLAGPDVAPYTKWTDRWGRPREDFPAYLTDIRRARLDKPAAWTWKTELPEGDTVRLHVVPVGGALEAIAGTGRSPAWPEEWRLDYVVLRRHAPRGERSLFLSLIESWQTRPVIRGIRLLSESPPQIHVEREDGWDEITLVVPDGPSRTTAPRPLGVRVRSDTGGKLIRDVRVGDCNDGDPGYLHMTLAAVNYPGRQVALRAEPRLDPALAKVRTIRIFSDQRSALYRVLDARRDGDLVWVTLDRTALLGRVPVVAKEGDGVLRIGADLPFWFRRPDRRGDHLPVTRDAYSGALLGEGEAASRIKGVAGRRLFLMAIPEDAIEKEYLGREMNIWQYAPGDRVEVPLVRTR